MSKGFAYVVTEPCIGTKDRSCVEVCPVDCFYELRDSKHNSATGIRPSRPGDFGLLLIHPDECITCGACEPECPVEAIYADDSVPEKWVQYIELNAKCQDWPEAELDEKRVTERVE